MNEAADSGERAAADAGLELARLQGQVEAARALLVRLLQDVVVAESRLGASQASQLLEANEQLVVAALRHQADAETAAQALNDAARSAEVDALTQLPNRVLLLDRLTLAISNARRHGQRLALLFLDLDDFKRINDTLGHAVGNEVLQRTAHCLAGSVRDADTVSRYDDDEFVILLTEVTHAADAVRVADKVSAALRASGGVGDRVARLSASIGISLYPDDGEDADTLIGRADAAMYRAKRVGLGGYAFHGAAPHAGYAEVLPRAEHKQRNAQLREANEHLVLAALGAQELQAAAEQAQRRQMEFLTVVAHELHNPLAPIRIATALLGRVRTDEPLLPRAQAIIEQQVAHMSRPVGKLLALSRSGTGTRARTSAVARVDDHVRTDTGTGTDTPQREPRTVDLAGVVDAVVQAWRPAMQARSQHLELSLPRDALEVHADPVALAQILGNLLDNASKYTHEDGTIGMAIEAVGGVVDGVVGDRVVISVSGNGIGITAEALPDVFEPFAQDPHAIGFNGVGLGIGLTVVRQLAQAHGGGVVAHSDGPGLGSRFVVTLPMAPAAGRARG